MELAYQKVSESKKEEEMPMLGSRAKKNPPNIVIPKRNIQKLPGHPNRI